MHVAKPSNLRSSFYFSHAAIATNGAHAARYTPKRPLRFRNQRALSIPARRECRAVKSA